MTEAPQVPRRLARLAVTTFALAAGAFVASLLLASPAAASHQPPAEANNPCAVDGHRVFFSQDYVSSTTGGVVRVTYYTDANVSVSYDGGDVASTGYVEADPLRQHLEGMLFFAVLPSQAAVEQRRVDRPEIRDNFYENELDPETGGVVPLYERTVPKSATTTPGAGPYPLLTEQQKMVQFSVSPQRRCVSAAGVQPVKAAALATSPFSGFTEHVLE